VDKINLHKAMLLLTKVVSFCKTNFYSPGMDVNHRLETYIDMFCSYF